MFISKTTIAVMLGLIVAHILMNPEDGLKDHVLYICVYVTLMVITYSILSLFS